MATATTKTLNRYSVAGYTFERGKVTILPYGVAVMLSEHPKASERLNIKISAAEHAENYGKAEPEGTESSTPVVLSEEEKLEAIREAVASLDVDNEAHFTKAGLPDARALSSILGWQVTSGLRDKAMDVATQDHATKPTVKIIRKAAEPPAPLDTGEDPTTQGAVTV